MKFAQNMVSITILAVIFALVGPAPVSAADECPNPGIFAAKIGGQCIYFTKDEGAPYSTAGCTAKEQTRYGTTLTFSCPQELIKMWEDKKAADQKKILDQQEEAKRLADEELDRKIQEAVEAKLKQQERVRQEEIRNEQVVPTQAPVITAPIAVPTASPQPTKPSVPAEVITKTPPVSAPATDAPKESLDNPTVSESVPVDVVPSTRRNPRYGRTSQVSLVV